MGNIFKGFKQVKEGASFENGYIYFVRNESNSGATDGYIRFNGKEYGTGEELRDFIGSLPSGSGNTVIEYIQKLGVDLTALIGAEETAREGADATLQTNIDNLSERIDVLEDDTHNHENKAVLDGITAAKVEAWDAAERNAKNYAKDYSDELSGNTVSALNDLKDDMTVTVSTEDESGSILKSYTINQGGSVVATIDIPKDLVVSGGEIIESGSTKYLQLTIANSDKKVNIPVGDLCDVYAGDNTTIEVNSGNVISVKANVFDAAGAAATAKQEAITAATAYTDTQLESYAKSADTVTAISNAKSEAITAATAYTDTKIANLSGATVSALSAEITARESGDTDLQTAINEEASARTAADAALLADIANEVSARTAAVSALDTRIDALEGLTGSTASALQQIDAADNSVTIGTKTSDKHQTVAVNISQNVDNALSLKTDGLFAAIYYDGDDVN